jgi:hypothetical protein
MLGPLPRGAYDSHPAQVKSISTWDIFPPRAHRTLKIFRQSFQAVKRATGVRGALRSRLRKGIT